MKTFSKLTFVLALTATLTACQGKDSYIPSYPPGEPETTVTIDDLSGQNPIQPMADSPSAMPFDGVPFQLVVTPVGNPKAEIGEYIQLKAFLLAYEDNGNLLEEKDVTKDCIWFSDSGETIEEKGTVTAEYNGHYIVSASYPVEDVSYVGKCMVTFTKHEYTRLSIEYNIDNGRGIISCIARTSGPVPFDINLTASFSDYGTHVYKAGLFIYSEHNESTVSYTSFDELPPTEMTIEDAYWPGGKSEYYDEDRAIYYVLSY